MIRLSRGISSLTSRQHRPSHLRYFSKEADEKPKGIPYSKLTVGVPKERFPLEKRVAATPEVSIDWIDMTRDHFISLGLDLNLNTHELQSVSKLVKPGFSVLIEKGAGSPSFFSDADYEAAGAKIVERDDVWKDSDIVMKVRYLRPS
jgi:NAD(P) transhydrogenase